MKLGFQFGHLECHPLRSRDLRLLSLAKGNFRNAILPAPSLLRLGLGVLGAFGVHGVIGSLFVIVGNQAAGARALGASTGGFIRSTALPGSLAAASALDRGLLLVFFFLFLLVLNLVFVVIGNIRLVQHIFSIIVFAALRLGFIGLDFRRKLTDFETQSDILRENHAALFPQMLHTK